MDAVFAADHNAAAAGRTRVSPLPHESAPAPPPPVAMAASPLHMPRWLPPLFVAVCTLAAFLNSLDGEFLMDDYCEILDNPRMDVLWPPWDVMLVGNELPSRPVPYLTFAIDRALWGRPAFGHHVTNLAIHLAAALALFFLTRATLESPRLRAACGDHAALLAAIVAALWGVHPLHTQAVTYIYQRLESLTAMLCLVSLAAFAGGVARRWDARWLAGSVVASTLAMFSKETAVVLPLLVASYDWLFCVEPPPPPGRRPRFYAALGATWLLLGLQMVAQSRRYEATGAFAESPLAYFLTQPRVILHYLHLAFWPAGLCFDLSIPILKTWSQIVPSLAYVAALGVAVAWGLARRRAWAWPGVVLFLALAPSSSFMPLAAVAEEYRMYLALAGVVGAVVVGGHAVVLRWTPPGAARSAALRAAAGLAVAAILALVVVTQARNRVYATPGGVWLDVVEKGRGGTRAYWNLALACDAHGSPEAALEYADEVFSRNQTYDVYEHLANRRLSERDPATAERYLRHAVAARTAGIAAGEPVAMEAVAALATVLALEGQADEAESLAAAHLERVRGVLGAEDPRTIGLLAVQAAGLLRSGHRDAAARLADTARDAHAKLPKRGGPAERAAAACLADLLRKLDRPREAAAVERLDGAARPRR